MAQVLIQTVCVPAAKMLSYPPKHQDKTKANDLALTLVRFSRQHRPPACEMTQAKMAVDE